METGSGANKHPLEPPVQQGPPQKHVRPKPFPYGQLSTSQTSMAAPSTADMLRPGTPCPKGPPAEYMPAPPEVTSMPTSASAAVPEPYVTENGKIRKVRSVTDIDWGDALSMSSLNPTSREALDHLQHLQNCVCFEHEGCKRTGCMHTLCNIEIP